MYFSKQDMIYSNFHFFFFVHFFLFPKSVQVSSSPETSHPPPYEVDMELTQPISSGVAPVNSESTSHPPTYEVDTELTHHISIGVAPVNSQSTSPPPYEVDTELTQHIFVGVAPVKSMSTPRPPHGGVDLELQKHIPVEMHLSSPGQPPFKIRAVSIEQYIKMPQT